MTDLPQASTAQKEREATIVIKNPYGELIRVENLHGRDLIKAETGYTKATPEEIAKFNKDFPEEVPSNGGKEKAAAPDGSGAAPEMTKAEIMEALDKRKIAYDPKANKAALLEIYNAPENQPTAAPDGSGTGDTPPFAQ